MIQIKDNCYKGTRILLGNEKRDMINHMSSWLIDLGYQEISFPIIQQASVFDNKVGDENTKMMYNFTDQGKRALCLAPEYTAPIQLLNKRFKYEKDVKLFYIQECFRGERPQAGRFRQFTQLGVEVLNPKEITLDKLTRVAWGLLEMYGGYKGFEINRDVTRGLDYYKDGKGFEITLPELGNAKQICGGGEYEGGIGFAIGIDRLIKIE